MQLQFRENINRKKVNLSYLRALVTLRDQFSGNLNIYKDRGLKSFRASRLIKLPHVKRSLVSLGAGEQYRTLRLNSFSFASERAFARAKRCSYRQLARDHANSAGDTTTMYAANINEPVKKLCLRLILSHVRKN